MDCQKVKELYVSNDLAEIDSLVTKLSQDIHSKSLAIVDVITGLKDLLISLDKDDRFYAVSLLTLLIEKLDSKLLNHDQIKCFFDFYIDRSKDDPKILGPVFRGFSAMIDFPDFEFSFAELLIHLLNNDICKDGCSSDTLKSIYKVLRKLLDRFYTDFTRTGSRFVFAFLSIVDGETNSGVLEDVFYLYQCVASAREFEPFKEEIFDSISGYFPIIYSKEPDPKLLETKEKIQTSLIRALCADSTCSQMAVSLALEKLDSVSIYSKISSYKLLQEAFSVYFGWQNLKPFVNEIWTNIRMDCLKKVDDDDDHELVKCGLKAFKIMGTYLVPLQDEMSAFYEKIWLDLKTALTLPSLKLVLPAIRIITTFASQNESFQIFYYERAIELLFQSYIASNNPDEKSDYLSALGKIFDERRFYESYIKEENILNQYMPQIMDEMLTCSDTKNIGIMCDVLCNCIRFLKFETMIEKFAVFLQNIRKLPDFFVLIQYYCKCIEAFCEAQPYRMTKSFVDPLLNEFGDAVQSPEFVFNSEAELNLEILLCAAKNPSIFSCVYDFILNYYHKLSSLSDKNGYFLLLLTLLTEDKYNDIFYETSRQEMYKLLADKFLPRFLEIFFDEVLVNDSNIDSVLFIKINILLKIVCALNTGYKNEELVKQLVFTKNVNGLVFGRKVYRPLDLNTMSLSQLTLYYLICNSFYCQSDILTSLGPKEIIETILNDIDTLIKYHNHESLALYSLVSTNLYQVFLALPLEDVHSQATKVLAFINARYGDGKSIVKTELLTALLMTMLTYGFDDSYPYFDLLLDSLNDSTYDSSIATRLIKIYSTYPPYDPYGTSFMYKFIDRPIVRKELSEPIRFSQKFANKILEKYCSTGHCSMFMFLMEYYHEAPKCIFKDTNGQAFFAKFLPIILDGLYQFGDQCAINCFVLLRRILASNPPLFEPHLVRISKSCIHCSVNAKSLRIRREALLFMVDMVQKFKNSQTLISIKNELSATIRPTLSDPKRLVRTVAANLNIRLCMLGQPGY